MMQIAHKEHITLDNKVSTVSETRKLPSIILVIELFTRTIL